MIVFDVPSTNVAGYMPVPLLVAVPPPKTNPLEV
jgi:hypothetical protein